MLLLALGCAVATIETPEGEVKVLHLTAKVDAEQVTEVTVAAALSAPVATRIRCVSDADPTEAASMDLATSDAPYAVFDGLLSGTAYTCGLGLAGEDPVATASVTTGTWDDVPAFEQSGDIAAMTGAYTLFNNGPTCDLASAQQVWIVDPEGRPRWGYTVPEVATGDIDSTLLPNGHILLGGGSGAPGRGDGVLRELTLGGEETFHRTTPTFGVDYTHTTALLDDGQELSLVWQSNTGTYGTFTGFGVELLDRATGTASWTWQSQSAVDAGTLPSGQPNTDAFHANAVRWFPDDPEGASYWLSLAQLNQVIRVDPTTGAVSWRLGYGGDFRLYDTDGTELTTSADFWEFQHAISMEAQGTHVLLHLHDNGYTRGWSRLLDLDVDPTARTATIVWQWTEPEWVERNGGDYDVLSTGHRLATQGHCSCCDASGDRQSSITEVDPTDGSVVWRLIVPGDSEFLYRSSRLDGCALFHNEKYCPTGG